MQIFRRQSRAAIRFSGSDAEKLLNDVLTAEITADTQVAHWWALLSPQGKIQAEGLAAWHDGAFWLDVHRDVAEAFLKRMKLYRLRAKVEIEDLRDTHAVGWAEEAPETGTAAADPRAAGLGFRLIASKDEAADWLNDETPYHARRIGNGIAELGQDFEPDTTFPHDVAMDLLSGVDFRKGCYVGQEVVSRMQHRGTARRRPVIVSGADAVPGTAIMAREKEAGTIGQSAEGKAIAIVRLDRFGSPPEAMVEGKSVQLALPDWAQYRFGDSGSSGGETES